MIICMKTKLGSFHFGDCTSMSPRRIIPKVTTVKGDVIAPKTFAISNIISYLWDIIFPPLSFIFFSSSRQRCLRLPGAVVILFLPSLSSVLIQSRPLHILSCKSTCSCAHDLESTKFPIRPRQLSPSKYNCAVSLT